MLISGNSYMVMFIRHCELAATAQTFERLINYITGSWVVAIVMAITLNPKPTLNPKTETNPKP